MIVLLNPDVTIEFFSHRNPQVIHMHDNTRHDVRRVEVHADVPGNHRRWLPVNYHDCVALRQAINNANITSHRSARRELQLVFNAPVTFMGVPLVHKVSLNYMLEPTEHDSSQLELARIGNHMS
jgi:hypothetical protein